MTSLGDEAEARGHHALASALVTDPRPCVHIECRKVYTRPTRVAAAASGERKKGCPPTAERPPRTAAVNYKRACFFCSELCAHGYKSVGILKPDRLASSYWPVHFAEATRHQLPLVEGVSFGDEVPIEFTTPEVGAMR